MHHMGTDVKFIFDKGTLTGTVLRSCNTFCVGFISDFHMHKPDDVAAALTMELWRLAT